MTADAIVSFDPAQATELAYRHKRGGQLTSKMRFQTAQLDAYNQMAARLREGLSSAPGVSVLGDATANILFCQLPQSLLDALRGAGFDFYDDRWEPGIARFVTSFAHTETDIDTLLAAIRGTASVQVALPVSWNA